MRMTLEEVASALYGHISPLPQSSTALTNSILKEGGLIDVLPGKVVQGQLCDNAQIDSRAVRPGSLFFCLKGEHVDGHDFAKTAADAGAVAIVATRDPFVELRSTDGNAALPVVFLVDDSVRAMWRLALSQRAITSAHVIGITGSAGKTTLKETLAHVLSHMGKTSKNEANFNNQIGLPLSMLNADNDARFWVMELGISNPYDMDELGAIMQPDTVVILNVGAAHEDGLKDKGVAYYKSRFLAYVTAGGKAFVSSDYDELNKAVQAQRKVENKQALSLYNFSVESQSGYSYAGFNGYKDPGLGVFTLQVGGQKFTAAAPFLGKFGAENIAAVSAVAIQMGMDVQTLQQRLETVSLPKQRFARQVIGSTMIIDDSYNANPLSAGRMVEAAANLAVSSGRDLILVMGEMLELGPMSGDHHKKLGYCMAKALPKTVFWKGSMADDIRRGLLEGGYTGPIYPVSGGQEFLGLMEELSVDDCIVLFKGSRGNQLERFVDVFMDHLKEKPRAI